MITEERHELILEKLKEKGIIKINELVELTKTSESTIRRDLTILEKENYLKRIHGGAKLLKGKYEELSYKEKKIQNILAKDNISKYAASLIEDGDSIYLDAGTTTFEMIKYINKKNLIIVTNGLKHIDELVENNIQSYVLGGKVKIKTKAVVGIEALKTLEKFRFDKCFIGTNGIHLDFGFTTPDTEEGIIKESAINQSKEVFILADASKFGEVSLFKFGDLNKATILTNDKIEDYDEYLQKTKVKVVRDI